MSHTAPAFHDRIRPRRDIYLPSTLVHNQISYQWIILKLHKLLGGNRPDQFRQISCPNLASTDLISKPHLNIHTPLRGEGKTQLFRYNVIPTSHPCFIACDIDQSQDSIMATNQSRTLIYF